VKKKEDARELRRYPNTSRYTDDSLIAVSLITDAYETNEGEETETNDTEVTVAKTDVVEEEVTAAESEEVEAAPEPISADMEESIRRHKEKIESMYGLSGMDKLKSVVPVMLKDLRPRDCDYREKLYQFKNSHGRVAQQRKEEKTQKAEKRHESTSIRMVMEETDMEPQEAPESGHTNNHEVTQVGCYHNDHGVIIEDVDSEDSDYEDTDMRTDLDNLKANKRFFVTSDRVEELPSSPTTEAKGPHFPLRKLFPTMDMTKVNKITEMEPSEFKGILINSILKRAESNGYRHKKSGKHPRRKTAWIEEAASNQYLVYLPLTLGPAAGHT
jgi:hypothetical protein